MNLQRLQLKVSVCGRLQAIAAIVCAAWLTTGTTLAQTASPAEESADKTQAPPVPFVLQPYRVAVELRVLHERGARNVSFESVRQEISDALESMYGRMWRLTFLRSGWLTPGTPTQVQALQPSELVDISDPGNPFERYSETELDKVLFITVLGTSAGFAVTCREFDTRLHDLSPILTQHTPQPYGIAPVAAGLVRDSFRPVLKYHRQYSDDDGNSHIELLTQAGELTPPDTAAQQVRKGDVLRLFQRMMNRRNPTKLRQLRPLQLTYIRVTAVDLDVSRGLTTGAMLSHGPSTLFGSRSRHAQQLALRQRPAASSSKLRLIQRSRENKPLICQRVSVAFKLRSHDQDQAPQLQLLSDRNGDITIPLNPDFPTVWVYVYSGTKTLARVPYAPGLLPSDSVLLPNDSIRLAVEGDLKLFQDELIDTIALREVQFSLAKKAVQEQRTDDVKQHLAEYFALPEKDDFIDKLSLIQVDAERRARENNNRFAERTVQQVCQEMRDSLDLFFNEKSRSKRMSAINNLRRQAGID